MRPLFPSLIPIPGNSANVRYVYFQALVRVASHPQKRELIGSAHGMLLLGTLHFQAGSVAAATTYFQLAREEILTESELKERLHRLLQQRARCKASSRSSSSSKI
jgi:hypothetical protein